MEYLYRFVGGIETEGAMLAAKASGVRLIRTEPDAAIFRIGSGDYRFSAAAPKDRNRL